MEEGENVDVIYLDFAKVFDKADHCILLRKLKDISITGKLGQWLYKFLIGRSQSVVVNGISTEPSSVRSGVPQGTVLGPMLLKICVLDIDGNIENSFVSSFADGTYVSRGIRTESNVAELQNDLNSVYNWAELNNINFNDTNFELLLYGNNEILKDSTKYLGPLGAQIEEDQHVKDLGVIMSNDATFSEHIRQVSMKARKYAGWILRTFRTREETLLLTLWKL